jgi:hypothetical protein
LSIALRSDLGATLRQATATAPSTVASLANASRTLVLPRRPSPRRTGTKVLGATCVNIACCSDVSLTVARPSQACESLSFHPKLGMSSAIYLYGFRHRQRNAAKIIRRHSANSAAGLRHRHRTPSVPQTYFLFYRFRPGICGQSHWQALEIHVRGCVRKTRRQAEAGVPLPSLPQPPCVVRMIVADHQKISDTH